MHAPTPPHCTPTQPIPAPCQAELRSPEKVPVIAACVHTVDGQGDHRAPGSSSAARQRWKAQCAMTVLGHLMKVRDQRRREALASASSRGPVMSSTWAGPSIIMVGDLNTTEEAMREALQQLPCTRGQADRRMAALHNKKPLYFTTWKLTL